MANKMRDLHDSMLRRDPAYREAYEALEEEFDLAGVMIAARKRAGLTQQDVAERMGVSQPAVAKIESGKTLRVDTLQRYAKAVGARLNLSLEQPNDHTPGANAAHG